MYPTRYFGSWRASKNRPSIKRHSRPFRLSIKNLMMKFLSLLVTSDEAFLYKAINNKLPAFRPGHVREMVSKSTERHQQEHHRVSKTSSPVAFAMTSTSVPNNDLLTAFTKTLNGKEGGGSHLMSVPPHLSEDLISSSVIQGEDGMGGAGLGGSGFEFGVDPNEDPELALALRVSMEEQRQRQEEEARRAQTASSADGTTPTPAPIKEGNTIKKARAQNQNTSNLKKGKKSLQEGCRIYGFPVPRGLEACEACNLKFQSFVDVRICEGCIEPFCVQCRTLEMGATC